MYESAKVAKQETPYIVNVILYLLHSLHSSASTAFVSTCFSPQFHVTFHMTNNNLLSEATPLSSKFHYLSSLYTLCLFILLQCTPTKKSSLHIPTTSVEEMKQPKGLVIFHNPCYISYHTTLKHIQDNYHYIEHN